MSRSPDPSSVGSGTSPSLLQLRKPTSLVLSEGPLSVHAPVASGSSSSPVTPTAAESGPTHARSQSPASTSISGSYCEHSALHPVHSTKPKRAQSLKGWECDGAPLVSESDDIASAMLCPKRDASPVSDRLLKACGAVGEMVPRQQWQPDESSALCTFPMCSNLFPPTNSYFSLGPRRHHCRMCGLLFCALHSSGRATLLARLPEGGSRTKHNQRICDMCDPTRVPESTFRPSDSQRMLTERQLEAAMQAYQEERRGSASSGSSHPSVHVVTPLTNDAASIDIVFGLRKSTATRNPLSSFGSSVEDAPLQTWMGKDGVLSLYPLAAHASHSRDPSPAPVVAKPLFQPSLAMRREAKERERLRVCARNKKHIKEQNRWVGVYGGPEALIEGEGSDEEDL